MGPQGPQKLNVYLSFMMFYIDKLKRQSVEEVLSDLGDYKLMPFEIDKYGSRVIINVETLSW